MVKLIDLAGQRFGRWTALAIATGEDARSYVRWRCICDCGVVKLVARTSLRSGESQSCGCWQVEGVKARRTDHGQSRTKEYYAWRNMRSRCYNTKDVSYPNYGGRGIRVCERWKSFSNFLKDMGQVPKGLTLERIDNEKGYSKENCEWATRAAQQQNKRNSRKLAYGGQTLTLAEWARLTGIPQKTLAYRAARWASVEDILTTPPHSGNRSINF